VPGSAIVILAATLNAVAEHSGHRLVLVLSVDWFIGMARALGNLIGNCIATVVIAAWEGDLDRDKAQRVLEEPNWWMSRRLGLAGSGRSGMGTIARQPVASAARWRMPSGEQRGFRVLRLRVLKASCLEASRPEGFAVYLMSFR